MTNITGRLLTGSVDTITLRAPNGTVLVRLPVERTPNSQVYVSQHPMDPVLGHYYLQVCFAFLSRRGLLLQNGTFYMNLCHLLEVVAIKAAWFKICGVDKIL